MKLHPPYLKKGDRIAIISSSSTADHSYIDQATKILEGWGLEVVFGKTLFLKNGFFAGTDAQRAADMQRFLDDISVRAILQARGGFGAFRIMDQLDYSTFSVSPKWICGYSDTTYLHLQLNSQIGFQSIHCTMPADIYDEGYLQPSWESLRKALFGIKDVYQFNAGNYNIPGEVTGEIMGGNLSVLLKMVGTDCCFNPEGKILFFEEVGEHYFTFDALLRSFRKAGVLSKLKGIVVGTLSKMVQDDPEYPETLEEIVLNCVKDYGYPVAFNFPAGHQGVNLALRLGSNVSLKVTHQVCTLECLQG